MTTQFVNEMIRSHRVEAIEAAQQMLSTAPLISNTKQIPVATPRCSLASGVSSIRLPPSTPAFVFTSGHLPENLTALSSNTMCRAGPQASNVLLITPSAGLLVGSATTLRPYHNNSNVFLGVVSYPVDSNGTYDPVEFLSNQVTANFGAQATALVTSGNVYSGACAGKDNELERFTADRGAALTPLGTYAAPLGPLTRNSLVPLSKTWYSSSLTIATGQSQPLDTSNDPLYIVQTSGNPFTSGSMTSAGSPSYCSFSHTFGRTSYSAANSHYFRPFLFNPLVTSRVRVEVNMITYSACAANSINTESSVGSLNFTVPFVDGSGTLQSQVISTIAYANNTKVCPSIAGSIYTPVCFVFDVVVPPFATEMAVSYSGIPGAGINFLTYQISVDTFAPTIRPFMCASGLGSNSSILLNSSCVYAMEPTPALVLLLGLNPHVPRLQQLTYDIESSLPYVFQQQRILFAPGEMREIHFSPSHLSPALSEVVAPHPQSGTFVLELLSKAADFGKRILSSFLPGLAGAVAENAPQIASATGRAMQNGFDRDEMLRIMKQVASDAVKAQRDATAGMLLTPNQRGYIAMHAPAATAVEKVVLKDVAKKAKSKKGKGQHTGGVVVNVRDHIYLVYTGLMFKEGTFMVKLSDNLVTIDGISNRVLYATESEYEAEMLVSQPSPGTLYLSAV